MKIGALQKVSLIDYPGKISAVVFTQGCNFRCGYCHNPQLVLPELFQATIPEGKIFAFLKTRIGKIEGVVITGGEPTIHTDLIDFIKEIKALGFFVKLDTNGNNPMMLKEIIDDKLADYIAIDIKATLEKYNSVCGIDVYMKNIKESIKIIMNSGLDYQFRTTVVKSLLDLRDLKKIYRLIKGADNYVLQPFRFNKKIINNSLSTQAEYTEEEIQEFQKIVKSLIQ